MAAPKAEQSPGCGGTITVAGPTVTFVVTNDGPTPQADLLAIFKRLFAVARGLERLRLAELSRKAERFEHRAIADRENTIYEIGPGKMDALLRDRLAYMAQ